MTKRSFTELSDEIEPVIKRSRHSISPTSFAIEEDQLSLSSNSHSEHADDIIEVLQTTMDGSYQSLNTTIIISSDDETTNISSSTSSIISTTLSDDIAIVNEEINIRNDEEIIDLTEDESNSTYYSLDQLEHKTSIDVEECPMCLETFSDLQYTGVYLMITQCNHVMCILCWEQLLANSSQCPLCRENVNVDTLMPYCTLN